MAKRIVIRLDEGDVKDFIGDESLLQVEKAAVAELEKYIVNRIQANVEHVLAPFVKQAVDSKLCAGWSYGRPTIGRKYFDAVQEAVDKGIANLVEDKIKGAVEGLDERIFDSFAQAIEKRANKLAEQRLKKAMVGE